MEDLVSEKKVSKKKIKKTMMDMVFIQILSRLNNEFPVSYQSYIFFIELTSIYE